MLQTLDYICGEILYQGPETRIRRATHSTSGERLVVKSPVSDTPSLRTLGRLAHEYQILVKLSTVLGVAWARALHQQGGSAYLWLEDPGLRSLDRLIAERGRLPLEAALRIGLALSRVLQSVHAAGVVHKDIKPQNVIAVETRRVSLPGSLHSVGFWQVQWSTTIIRGSSRQIPKIIVVDHRKRQPESDAFERVQQKLRWLRRQYEYAPGHKRLVVTAELIPQIVAAVEARRQ